MLAEQAEREPRWLRMSLLVVLAAVAVQARPARLLALAVQAALMAAAEAAAARRSTATTPALVGLAVVRFS